MRKTNAIKARKAKARNFGGEAVLVRSMDCIVHAAAESSGLSDRNLRNLGWTACGGAPCAHHVHPRQRGGVGEGRFGLFNACARHGEEAGEASPIHGPSTKRRKFESLYSVNVPAIADALALAHPRPLGILGLADRFVWWHEHDALGDRGDAGWAAKAGPERLVDYDLAALLSWVRRHMDTCFEEKAITSPTLLDREFASYSVTDALGFGAEMSPQELKAGGLDDALDVVWALCNLARPS